MKHHLIRRLSIYAGLMLTTVALSVLVVTLVKPAHADAQAGNALDFNTQQQYAHFGNDPSLNAATSIRTMEARVKFHSLAGQQVIVSRSCGSSGMEISLDFGTLSALASGTGGSSPATYNAVANLQIEKWYHVAATHSGPGSTITLYIDGVPVATGTAAATIRDSSSDPDIWCADPYHQELRVASWGGGGRFLNGQVDEVRLWNTTRTAEQIRDHLYTELTGSETGLVGYYPMNETAGLTAPDRSTTVKSITVTVGGGYTSIPTVTISGGGGSGATAAVAAMQLNSITSLASGGTGYTVNDVLTINNGTFSAAATLTVTTVNGTGAVTAAVINDPGVYTILPANAVSVSGGTGTGAAFNLDWSVRLLQLLTAGSGYTANPTVSFSSGTAAATANVSNNGVLYDPPGADGPATWVTSGAFYGPGNALDFDGANDFVSATSPLSVIDTNTDLTLMAWLKRDAASGVRDIVSLGSVNSTETAELRLNNLNQLEYGRNPAAWQSVISDASIDQGVWTHVAVIQQGATVQLYINGVFEAAGSISSTTNVTGTYLGARRYNGANDQFFAGQLDEVRMWNVALSPAQVRDYMNQSLAGDEPGLVAYYRMDYGTANGSNAGLTTLYDITANANDGELNNFALSGTTSNWVASNAFNVWIGSAGPSWSITGNWSRGAVPTTTDNLSIVNYAGGNAPIITSTVDFNHLVIGSNATLVVSGSHLLNIGGNWINNATFNAGDSTLAFSENVTHGLVLSTTTTFNNLTVGNGAVLVETETADNAIVNNALTNNGTLRKTQSAATLGNRTFGLTGVAVNVDTVGNLNTLTVDRRDVNHPNAGVTAMQTGRYWKINRTLTGGSTEGQLDITLPYTGTSALSKACRWVNGSGAGFDCGQDTDNTVVLNTSVRRNNYATAAWNSPFDTWTVGNSNSPQAITVQVAPSTLFANSGATSTITATVVDSLGNQVAGVSLNGLTLPASLGTVSALGSTNALGQALGDWTAGTVPGTGWLNAGNGVLTGTASITLAVDAPYTVTLAAAPTALSVGSTSHLTVTVTDQFGNLLNGVAVTLTTDLGNVVSPIVTTNGLATSSISSTLPGTAHLTATADSRIGTTAIVFAPGAPFTLTLAANPTSLTVGNSSTMTATVTDQFGNFVADGTSVAFAASLGDVLSPRTTTNGVATSTLTSLLAGTSQVTATSGSATQATEVIFMPGTPFTVTVQASPTVLVADGSSTATITATVTDQFNNFVVDGTSIDFSTTLGAVSTPHTTIDGQAVATFTAGTIVGTATISATTNSRTGTTSVNLVPGVPFTVTLDANPSVLLVGNTSALTATITDQFGHFVADGTSVVFATSLGNVLSPRTTTNGVATSTLVSTLAGTAQVTATSGSAVQATDVTFVPGAPFTVTVQASPTTLTANGSSTSTITATVTDQFNNLVADGTVLNFSTTLGVVSTPHTTTNGQAVATFTAGTLVGTATISATANTRTGTTSVMLTPGAPFTLALAANPTSLTVGNSSTMTATVTDQFGNFVADGTSVAFAASLGDVLSPRTTTNGVATSTLTSLLAGTSQVTATSGSATQATEVIFMPGTPFTVTVQASPTVLVADGSSTATITATVTDQFNNFVVDGTSIDFSTTLGAVSTPRLTTNGSATTTFTSGVLSGSAIVTATVNSRSDSVSLTLLPTVVDLSTSMKTASASIVTPGEWLTYTIVLSNTGGTLGTGLTLTDALPLHTTYVTNSLTGSGATYNASLNQIEWAGSIPSGGSVTLSYTVVVDQAAHGSIVNLANVFILGVLDRTLTVNTAVRSMLYLPLIARNL